MIGQLELFCAGEASSPLLDSMTAGQRGTRYGSCGTEYVRGREAVMPYSGLEIDLADCEVLCISQEEG